MKRGVTTWAARGISVLALTMVIESCLGTPSRELISRIASPTRTHDALVVGLNGGATVAYLYEVFIVPHGDGVPDDKFAQFVAERVDSLKIQWAEPDVVDIGYAHAQISTFNNEWHKRNDLSTTIELRLKP